MTLDCRLDFFVLYSSISSAFGTLGQSNYSAANHFLDDLAHLRFQKKKNENMSNLRLINDLPITCINWGPWEIGMTRNTNLAERLKSSDLQMIEPTTGDSTLR